MLRTHNVSFHGLERVRDKMMRAYMTNGHRFHVGEELTVGGGPWRQRITKVRMKFHNAPADSGSNTPSHANTSPIT